MTTSVPAPRADSDTSARVSRERPDGASKRTIVTRVPLMPVAEEPERSRPADCSQCGSKGFNVHQRAWRTVRDPHIKRVRVARFVCKRCGATRRLYPQGIGPERQSAALKQISALLYCLGLTYRNVQQALQYLGCPLSMTTIRQDVLQVCAVEQTMRPFDRLHMSHVGPGDFAGTDGRLTIRLIGNPDSRRWLELEMQEQPGGAELEWRAHVCARQFAATPAAGSTGK